MAQVISGCFRSPSRSRSRRGNSRQEERAGVAGGAGGGGGDVLIDLADLNFGSSPAAHDAVHASTPGSLLDDLGLLRE